MAGMRDPGVDALSHLFRFNRPRTPSIPQPSQPVAEAPHIVFGHPPQPGELRESVADGPTIY